MIRLPSRDRLAAACLAFYAAVSFLLFPPAIAIRDEAMYLAGAYILRAGTIFSDVAGVSVWATVAHAGHLAPIYPPGMAALLLPFTFLPWPEAFALNLALQAVGFVLFRALLENTGIDRRWAFLYLFFPPLVLFSRTLMAEVPSAVATTAALLLYLRGPRGRAGAGLLLGGALFLRYANLLVFAGLLLAALTGDLRRRRLDSWPLLAGFLPGLAGFAVYNLAAYGQFGSGGYASAASFALSHLPGHLAFYVIDLLLVYPLLLLGPVLYRGPLAVESLAVVAVVMLGMSAYYYVDVQHGVAQNLLAGARLVLPAAPCLLLPYAGVLARLPFPAPTSVVAAALAGGVFLVISFVHQGHLVKALHARRVVAAGTCPTVPVLINPEGTKFLSPAWGSGRFRVDYGGSGPASVAWAQPDGSAELVDAVRAAAQLGDAPSAEGGGGWQVRTWRSPAC
ncbi:MAG: hypothetical protein NVS9B1_21120 [Candidatus Dormibacteraceae bacterium]